MAASTVLSTIHSIPGKKAGSKNSRKSVDSKRPTQPPIKCPECASQRIWRDGHRYVKTETGTIRLQRFRCRDCGRRFSENNCAPPDAGMGSNPTSHTDVNLFGTYLQPITRGYKASSKLSSSTGGSNQLTGGREAVSFPRSCLRKGVTGAQVARKAGPGRGQVCNLSQKTRMEKAERGATKLSEEEIKSTLFNFAWWMRKQGYRSSTIDGYGKRIKTLLRKGADLSDSEDVKGIIAAMTCEGGNKRNLCNAYGCYLTKEGRSWRKPRYRVETKMPFVPFECELDKLIHGCGKVMRAFLQGLKELGTDPGELFAVEWDEIDFKRKKVAINHPVKGHNPRILDVSDEWLRMVSVLPRASKRVWTAAYHSHYNNYYLRRNRLAIEYKNPRLRRIKLITFRHWAGTMNYHQFRSIMHTAEFLGHKSVANTQIYVHIHAKLFKQLESEYEVRRARSIKGMMALAAVGFEKYDQVRDIHLYKKPKTAKK